MTHQRDGSGSRRIRVQTRFDLLEGTIAINGGASTLHYLNVIAMSQNFLHLHPPLDGSLDWTSSESALAVATDSILFISEVEGIDAKPLDPLAAARFKRAPVRLRLGDYVIEGSLHVPPGGNPIARLNQDRHAFIALTSATVKGPEAEFQARFLAMNRAEILAFQQVEVGDEVDLAAEVEEAEEPAGATIG